VTGLDVLIIFVALAALFAIATYADWRAQDRHRRLERLRRRNLA
jgi:hypothetical protein